MKNVFLIGYRCTGKTTVGQSLAAFLGWRFVDVDAVIDDEIGCSIAEFVERHGWPAFREKEAAAIIQVSQKQRQVIATGGGAVISKANVACMRTRGTVVWLQALPNTIRRRMQADAGSPINRPSLTGQGSRVEIEQVLAEREPSYAKAAHHRIATDDLSISEVVEKISDLLESGL